MKRPWPTGGCWAKNKRDIGLLKAAKFNKYLALRKVK
jgi:hypothetical protein